MEGFCLHCAVESRLSIRGLCRRCQTNTHVRNKYPPSEVRKDACGNKPGKIPENPTPHAPGTVDKLELMIWRVANGYMPNHPQDFKPKANDVVPKELWLPKMGDEPPPVQDSGNEPK